MVFAAHTIFFYLTPAGYVKPADEMWGQAGVLSLTFFLFGLLPVSLYGAPVYVALARRGKASWPTVLGVGLLPGALCFLVAPDFGLYGSVTGSVVSLLTHAVCREPV